MSVWFDAQRPRQGLFHLLGFGVASGSSGALMKIELEERGMQVLLALTISGQECADASADGPNPGLPPHDLVRRLGLGIAQAIFEAAGGSLQLRHEADGLAVEVRRRGMGQVEAEISRTGHLSSGRL